MSLGDTPRSDEHAGFRLHEESAQLSPDIERRILFTRAALFWENLCACFWPLALYVGVLAALSLLDVWQSLPGLIHAGLFWVSFAGFLYIAWHGLMRFEIPSRDAAIERLERGNKLAHRPIAALADVMAEGHVDESAQDAVSHALWREHLRRAQARIGQPKVGWPSPELSRRDPRALRAAVLLLLAVGFAAAGSDWPKRLLSGFSPSFSLASAVPTSLDAWIAPPAYTGHAPIFLHSGELKSGAAKTDEKVLLVPQGSKFLARRGGGDDGTEILVDGKTRDFKRVDKRTEEIAYPIDKNQTLAIRHGGDTLGTWKVEVVPDNAPAVAFMGKPEATVGYALHVQFGAADDYGVESVKLKMNRPGKDDDVLTVDLPTAHGQKSVSGDHYQDLTDNPWAGETVVGRLEARDALDQVGVSEPVEFTLPEREFTNPIAKKLIAMRQRLKEHPEDRSGVKAGLAQITDNPKAFDNDLTTALALGDAYWRLQYDPSQEAIDAVRDTLWKTAVHLENDKVTRSRADLRALAEQLQKALAEGASQQEIERLMNQLQAALENYLRAMQAQARKENGGKSAQNQQNNTPNSQMITPDQLRQMLDKARSMSQTGAKQAASQLLSQLQSILENLSTPQGGGQQNPAAQAMQQAISQLDALARKQQDLMDRTFQQNGERMRGGQEGGSPGGEQGREQGGKGEQGSDGHGGNSMSGLAGQQGNLQKELEKILQGLGGKGVGVPQTLSNAGSSMGQAKSALGQSDAGGALGHQGKALQDLRSGIGQLVDSANRMAGQGQDGGGKDGRASGNTGGFGSEHVDLPSDADVQRSREILDELRKRSGEWQRPREELDYINRLLDVY